MTMKIPSSSMLTVSPPLKHWSPLRLTGLPIPSRTHFPSAVDGPFIFYCFFYAAPPCSSAYITIHFD